MEQQKFPFVVITVTVPAEVQSLLQKGCPISKPHDFLEASNYTVTILKHAHLVHSYHKIASSNPSRLEAHVGFFRLLMKGIFGPYVL